MIDCHTSAWGIMGLMEPKELHNSHGMSIPV